MPRWLIVTAVVISIAVAAFTGIRPPNWWCATLDAVSVFDGFHRRIAVGTLLRPLAMATGYSYWLFAAYSYVVLAVVLAVLTFAAARESLFSRRMLIIAWLLLPTGGFLFNEVGYFDQVLYLLLFAAIWLLPRNRVALATCLMCITPLVHEIAILSVIPVFGLVALRTVSIRRAFAATLPPAAINGLVLAISPARAGAVPQLTATLQSLGFRVREDALALFERTQAESWRLYEFRNVSVVVKPVAILVVATFLCLWVTDRRLWRSDSGRVPAAIGLLCSCVAIAAPALLVFAGWDGNRWSFLIASNFFVVVWISLDGRRAHELGRSAGAILITCLLILNHCPIQYFERYSPREIGSRPDRRLFLRQLTNGSLFSIPESM